MKETAAGNFCAKNIPCLKMCWLLVSLLTFGATIAELETSFTNHTSTTPQVTGKNSKEILILVNIMK